MIQVSPRLNPAREYPLRGIELPVAFPREPEPNINKCQTLRHNPDILDPEDHGAPVTIAAVTTTEIETETAVAEEATVASNKAAAPAPAVALHANRNRFR